MDKRLLKLAFVFLFAGAITLTSNIPILKMIGVDANFTLAVMLAPVFGALLGPALGIGTIVLSQLFGLTAGTIQFDSALAVASFMPIVGALFYFGSLRKNKWATIALPALAIVAFLAHPIGRSVWYYSLFWTLPIGVSLFKKPLDKLLGRFDLARVYLYALGAVFVDHSVGATIYLYALSIPAAAWIASIPLVPFERLLFAGGITVNYVVIYSILQKLKQKNVQLVAVLEPPLTQTVGVGKKR